MMSAQETTGPAARHRRLLNFLQSAVLLAGMAGLVAGSAWIIAGGDGIFWAAMGLILGLALGPRLSPRLLMRFAGARPISPYELPVIHRALDAVCGRAGLARTPNLYYLPSPALNAFAMGRTGNAAIAITDGMLRLLSARELLGVLAHEVSHIRNHDLWVMQLADALSQLTRLMSFAGIAIAVVAAPLFLMKQASFPWGLVLILLVAPGIGVLLQMGLSRTREYDADQDAAELTGDPDALAGALRKIDGMRQRSLADIFFGHRRQRSLLRSHPPTDERVARLRNSHLPGVAPIQVRERLTRPLPGHFRPAERRIFRWRPRGNR